MTATQEIVEGWQGDEEVEAVLAEFDGDPRKAIRALLDDIAVLADDRPEPRFQIVNADPESSWGLGKPTPHR